MIWFALLALIVLWIILLKLFSKYVLAFLEKSEPFLWRRELLHRSPYGNIGLAFARLIPLLFLFFLAGILVLTFRAAPYTGFNSWWNNIVPPLITRWSNALYLTFQVAYYSSVVLVVGLLVLSSLYRKSFSRSEWFWPRLVLVSLAGSYLVCPYMNALWSHYDYQSFNVGIAPVYWAFLSTAMAIFVSYCFFIWIISGKAWALLHPTLRGLATIVLALVFSISLLAGTARNKNRLRQKVRQWVLLQCLLFVVFVIGFVVAWSIWYVAGQKELVKARADVLAAGFQLAAPLTTGLPDEPNVATLLDQISKAPSMTILSVPKGKSKPLFGKEEEYQFSGDFNRDAKAGRLTSQEKFYAHQFLKEHEDAFRLVDKISETKIIQRETDYQDVPRNMGYALMVVRLLRVRALVQAMDGNAAGAAGSLQTGFCLGDRIGQYHSLIAAMIDTAIVNMMSSTAVFIVPRLQAKGYSGMELLSYLKPETLGKVFDDSLRYELFHPTSETILAGIKSYKNASKFKDVVGWWDLALDYPFFMWMEASRDEINIELMKAQAHPNDLGKNYENIMNRHSFFPEVATPRFAQMQEKANEAMTRCAQAQFAVEAGLFHQKNKRWPKNGAELKKWSRDHLGIVDIPAVSVTGAFVAKSPDPTGNQVTLAKRGEPPKTSASGWLYDNHSGAVYVNSTTHDSQNMAYSFYGFE